MSINNLNDLFEHLLQDMYYAEKQITKALPKMAEKASNQELIDGLETHLEETNDQIEILERVFEVTGLECKGEKCDAMDGLLKEGEKLLKECRDGATCDAAIIAACQKVEHYEIASYGTLCNIAKLLGEDEAAEMLHEILEQEKATDEKLTSMADEIEEEAMDQAA